MIRTLLAASLLWSSSAVAEDASPDAPRVVRLPSGDYLFNKAAFDSVDGELKRLQGLERQHAGESWLGPVLVGMLVGASVAIPTTYVILRASQPR